MGKAREACREMCYSIVVGIENHMWNGVITFSVEILFTLTPSSFTIVEWCERVGKEFYIQFWNQSLLYFILQFYFIQFLKKKFTSIFSSFILLNYILRNYVTKDCIYIFFYI